MNGFDDFDEHYATQTREEKLRNMKIFKCILIFYIILLIYLLCTQNYTTLICVALYPFAIYLLSLLMCYFDTIIYRIKRRFK